MFGNIVNQFLLSLSNNMQLPNRFLQRDIMN